MASKFKGNCHVLFFPYKDSLGSMAFLSKTDMSLWSLQLITLAAWI